jgi:hypothetical protein
MCKFGHGDVKERKQRRNCKVIISARGREGGVPRNAGIEIVSSDDDNDQ